MTEVATPDGKDFSPEQRVAVVGSLTGIANTLDDAPPSEMFTGQQMAIIIRKIAELIAAVPAGSETGATLEPDIEKEQP